MELTIKKSNCAADWFTIEKAEHENRVWIEQTSENSSRLMYSGRISNADIEGASAEMLGIAKAIRDGGRTHFTRCAVEVSGDKVCLWSPRNSEDRPSITLQEAYNLADKIESLLG